MASTRASLTGFFGVSYDSRYDKYDAKVRGTSLGRHETAEEAAQAVNDFIINCKLDLPLNDIHPVRLAAIRARKRLKFKAATMRVPKIYNYKTGPEAIIQDAIITFLRERDWLVRHLHGNTYQVGMPDLYCARKGVQRFIEVKNPAAYRFTPGQLEFFPELEAQGIGVWVLVAATQEEYAKLFKSPNWRSYAPKRKS